MTDRPNTDAAIRLSDEFACDAIPDPSLHEFKAAGPVATHAENEAIVLFDECGCTATEIDRSFLALKKRLAAGEDAAATEVFHRFAKRLIALARRRLDAVTRQKVDPEDVVQSVYRSFFTRHAQGEFDLDSWDGLWKLLALITVRKCVNVAVKLRADRRDAVREISLDSDATWNLIAADPTPEQAAEFQETLEQLMRGLDDWEREILSLRLQGYRIAEIAEHPTVNRAERAVRRALKRIRARLERLLDQDKEQGGGRPAGQAGK